MFETEVRLNRFQVEIFEQTVADIPSERLNERPPGNGHPPVWILGHLAICAELGEKLLGGQIKNMRWLPVFGPGSSDDVEDAEQYHRDELIKSIIEGYNRLCDAAAQANTNTLEQPHGFALLDGTPIETVGDLVAHLLTTHMSFHLAQLSAWRRSAGHAHLF